MSRKSRFPPEVTQNTLVDYPRLHSLVEELTKSEQLGGHVAEVGVYKGGTLYLLAEGTRRPVTGFDTFEGMPEVSEHDLHHTGDFADTSLGRVSALVGGFPHVALVQGTFPESLRYADVVAKYSLVHIDVDIYTSVKACLQFFTFHMLPGGVIILDDYNAPTCPGAKKATDEVCSALGLKIEPGPQSQVLIRF